MSIAGVTWTIRPASQADDGVSRRFGDPAAGGGVGVQILNHALNRRQKIKAGDAVVGQLEDSSRSGSRPLGFVVHPRRSLTFCTFRRNALSFVAGKAGGHGVIDPAGAQSAFDPLDGPLEVVCEIVFVECQHRPASRLESPVAALVA